MKFVKMHGCGNDYVYINGFEEQIENKEKLAQKVSDRHFGIGSDGIIFINSSEIADFGMEIYNADGSKAEMCGNGVRCVGKYVYESGLTSKTNITVESCGKIKYLDLTVSDGKVTKVRVNMGTPELLAERIPVITEKEKVVDVPIVVKGETHHVTCVSMGNPHAVVFMDEVDRLNIEAIGPYYENYDKFPQRINTEFVKVIDRRRIQMRVWERGSGETLACGTGCCAAAVACILNGKTDNQITVSVPGGEIEIEWDREENVVYMTGPAITVFSGEYPWEE